MLPQLPTRTRPYRFVGSERTSPATAMVRDAHSRDQCIHACFSYLLHNLCLQDADKVQSFKHRMNTLAYGEAMMAAARDYGNVRNHRLSRSLDFDV
jgi:hypothetical protein